MTVQFVCGSSIEEVYPKILRTVVTSGREIVIPDGSNTWKTVEFPGVIITEITDVIHGAPHKIGPYQKKFLEVYIELFLNSSDTQFDYTYGNRIRQYHYSIDQLQRICKILNEVPQSRRAIINIGDPVEDIEVVPCLQLIDFKIREKLMCVAYFRSHDAYRGFPANACALSELMRIVAGRCKIECGSLTIISNKAHIYLKDIDEVLKIIGGNA